MRIEYGFLLFTLAIILTRPVKNRTVAEIFLLILNLTLLYAVLFFDSATEAVIVLAAVAIHFLFLRFPGRISTFIAFLLPVTILFSVRTFTIHGVIGVSYLIFRMLSGALEVKSGKIQDFSLRQYLSYCFFFHTFKMGPVGSFEDHLISETHQGKKSWNDLNWTQLYRVIFGIVKYVFLTTYARNFARAFGFGDWGDADSISDLIVMGFASYVSVYLAFSGFNDIAIGLSHFLGYRMKENFVHPFKAGSVGEFWSNWHMSVTELLKDLIFYPLSITFFRKVGRRGRHVVMPFIFLILFLAIGVWHGSGENFVLLGLYHAFGATFAYYFSILMTKAWKGYRTSRIVQMISVIITQIFIALSFFFFDNRLDEIRAIINEL